MPLSNVAQALLYPALHAAAAKPSCMRQTWFESVVTFIDMRNPEFVFGPWRLNALFSRFAPAGLGLLCAFSTGCNLLQTGNDGKTAQASPSVPLPPRENNLVVRASNPVSTTAQVPLAPTQRIVVTKSTFVANQRTEKILWASAPTSVTTPVLGATPVLARSAPPAQNVDAIRPPPNDSAATPQPSVNALIVKGTPRPPQNHPAGWPMVLIGLLFLLGALGLVGWAFWRRAKGISTAPNVSAKDELLAGPGLLMKESSISRPRFDISDNPLPSRAAPSESAV
jgi:hypothetical protein